MPISGKVVPAFRALSALPAQISSPPSRRDEDRADDHRRAGAQTPSSNTARKVYAIVRGFVDGEELEQLKRETQAVYEEGLKHHATYRHGNLNFQIPAGS